MDQSCAVLSHVLRVLTNGPSLVACPASFVTLALPGFASQFLQGCQERWKTRKNWIWEPLVGFAAFLHESPSIRAITRITLLVALRAGPF